MVMPRPGIDPDAEAARVPTPIRPLSPLTETWDAGKTLHTCHQSVYPAGFFAPTAGAARRVFRFSDFGDPTVPTLYLGETEETAVAETILRLALSGSTIQRAEYANRSLSAVTLTRDLRLAMLHSKGLTAVGAVARDLTDTEVLDAVYQRTVVWGEAIYEDTDLDGIVWMSRPDNMHRAVMLFGDRVSDEDIDIAQSTRIFAEPADRDWLAELCREMGITLLV